MLAKYKWFERVMTAATQTTKNHVSDTCENNQVFIMKIAICHI